MRHDVNTGDERIRAVEQRLAVLNGRREFDAAIRCFEENRDTLMATGAPAGVALHHAAAAHASMGQYPVALQLARTAQHHLSAAGDTLPLAELFVTLGGILRDRGEMKEAERSLRDAESIFRRNDSPEGHCRALNLLAGLYFRQKQYDSSLDTLLDAIEVARSLGDREKIAYMLGNLGRIYTFIGDFAQAEHYLASNVELSEELDQDQDAARAYLSLAYVRMQTGNLDDAEVALDKAHQLLVATGSPRDEVMYLTYLGELAYRREELETSHQVLKQALAKAEALGSNTTLIGRVLRHLAEAQFRLDLNRSAIRTVNRAWTILEEAGDSVELGALTRLKARLRERDSQAKDARGLYREAIQVLGESGVRFEKAEALLAAGQSPLFSNRERLTYLFRAQEIYTRLKLSRRSRLIERLIGSLDSAMETVCDSDQQEHEAGSTFLTRNERIQEFLAQLPIIAKSDIPVLLTGETGVGKDQLARHYHSLARPDGPFVAINCASVPKSLLESELFGHTKGAFTGAVENKKGLFVAASGGTLFLDEIGDMPLPLQAKLLGVLESRTVTPLGSTKPVPFDVRLVAATNRDLREMVDKGEFRRDLYYRLSGISFAIPPLLERKEDIPLLLEHFLSQSRRASSLVPLPTELLREFLAYSWPGNVRELMNKVKRLDVMSELVAEGDLVELARSIFPGSETEHVQHGSLFERVEQFERELITEALLATGGNKSQAARLLGIHEATVRTKMKRYGISADLGSVN
jgi:transcriptional regulator with PAS, ATPase and Fis domain